MKKTNGFLMVIISGIIFGSMPLFARIFYKNGCSPTSLVFYRFLFALPFLFIINKKMKIDLRINLDELKNLIYISIFGYSSTAVLLFVSYNYIPTGLAMSLHFIYPILVTIGCVVFYKDKLSFKKAICTILCTAGIFLFLDEINIVRDNAIGVIFALVSGLTYSFYLIYLEKSTLRSMPNIKMVFYLSLISSVILFVYNSITNNLTTQMATGIWLILVLFSIFVTVGAVLLLQLGLGVVGAQNASILSTTEPITSVVIGILVFNERVNFKIILGIMLILLSVVLISLNGKKTGKVKEGYSL